MTTNPERPDDLLQQQIHDSLQKVSAYREKLKRGMSRSSIANIVLSALATLITGQATVLKTSPMGTWRFVCIIAAGFAASATIIAGVQKQLADPELLTEAGECVGKLRGLAVETAIPGYDVDKIKREYKQILTDCSRVT
jgi:hypothetical protein